jgi:hypothetical protein
VRDSCLKDLEALNSPLVFADGACTEMPNIISRSERCGDLHTELVSHPVQNARVDHRLFCAVWARTAKGRFDFARECHDTPLNRAALHRYFLSEWRKIEGEGKGLKPNQIDLFMGEAIDLALEPTSEQMSLMKRRKLRRWARMEYYNESKALSLIQ